jgi:hypothetical protein
MLCEICVISGVPEAVALPYAGNVDPVNFAVRNPLSVVPLLELSDPATVRVSPVAV